MSEQNASLGYAALKKETSKGTAVTPNTYVPYYSNTIKTQANMMSDEPVYGKKFKRLQTLRGIREHSGTITVMAEPNTAAYWFDMLAKKGTTTGSGPYTHPYTESSSDPNAYTLDVSKGSQVVRYFGLEASKIACGFDGEKMVLTVDVSALGSFAGREIASVSGTTVVLKTDYDPTPTKGLVASDLVAIKKADGSVTTNFTVSSITDATTIEVSATAAAFAAGDMLVLRAATPSLSILTPFIWGRTQFRFGADASAALSATQTRMESGTELAIIHEFENSGGSKRSGGFDPASLPRLQYDVEVKLRKFFDTPDEIKYFNAITKRALVMRSFAGASDEYELRVTLNNLAFTELDIPTDSAAIIYQDIVAMPNYDQSDGQGFDVKVINNVATI